MNFFTKEMPLFLLVQSSYFSRMTPPLSILIPLMGGGNLVSSIYTFVVENETFSKTFPLYQNSK